MKEGWRKDRVTEKMNEWKEREHIIKMLYLSKWPVFNNCIWMVQRERVIEKGHSDREKEKVIVKKTEW